MGSKGGGKALQRCATRPVPAQQLNSGLAQLPAKSQQESCAQEPPDTCCRRCRWQAGSLQTGQATRLSPWGAGSRACERRGGSGKTVHVQASADTALAASEFAGSQASSKGTAADTMASARPVIDAKAAEQMNLNVLRRIDPQIEEV